MKIGLEVGENCNPGFVAALHNLASTIDRLVPRRNRHEDLATVETSLAAAAARVEAEAVGSVLSTMDLDSPRIRVGGCVYKNSGVQPKTRRTLAGDVTIERHVYRAQGVRNGPALDPVAVRVAWSETPGCRLRRRPSHSVLRYR